MKVYQPAFRPDPASTVSLAVTTSTGSVSVQSMPAARHFRIFNSGSVTVFVEFGSSGVTAATTTGMPVAAGTVEIFGAGADYVAGIVSSGTATIYITPGDGI